MSDKTDDKSEDNCVKVLMTRELLSKIFSFLSIDELIRVERVCKHFQSCAEYWFGRQKSIAFNTYYADHRYRPMDQFIYNSYTYPRRLLESNLSGRFSLTANKRLILSLAEKLPNIEYLAINDFETTFHTLYDILEAFQSVKWLSICGLYGCTEQQYQQLGQLLSARVTTFVANPSLKGRANGVVEMIAQLTGLIHLFVSLNTNDMTTVSELLQCLPQTIKSFQINNTWFDEHLVHTLVESNAKQLDSLFINCSFGVSLEHIYDRMALKALTYDLNGDNDWQCLQSVAQNQTHLIYLRLNHQNFGDFVVTENVMQLSNVKTLHLYSCHPREEAFESLMKCFPQLKTLILRQTSIACHMEGPQDYELCFRQMYHLVAKHTAIKTLGLCGRDLTHRTAVLCEELNACRNLSAIHLDYCLGQRIAGEYTNICRQFVTDFIDGYTRDQQKWYTIRVHKDVTQDFFSGLQIPRNLRIRRDLR